MSAAPHIPVLLEEVLGALTPAAGEVHLDGTFGAGGYTAALLSAGSSVIAFDRDPSAIAAGRARFDGDLARLTLVEAPFDQLGEASAVQAAAPLDGAVFDFGVSSMQLDQGARGFSFMADGPLDMRMGDGRTAAAFVNEADLADIADVIHQYGEERRARHLANLIGAARDDGPITTTGALATIAEKALGKGGKIHPATRLFQALRIFVNDELGQIVRALIACERVLRMGGRLVAVSFHSLEDRIVKRFFAATSGRGEGGSRHLPEVQGPAATFEAKAKAIKPGAEEIDRNPRARSAVLRCGVRTGAAPAPWDAARLSKLGIPPMVFSSLQREWSVG